MLGPEDFEQLTEYEKASLKLLKIEGKNDPGASSKVQTAKEFETTQKMQKLQN